MARLKHTPTALIGTVLVTLTALAVPSLKTPDLAADLRTIGVELGLDSITAPWTPVPEALPANSEDASGAESRNCELASCALPDSSGQKTAMDVSAAPGLDSDAQAVQPRPSATGKHARSRSIERKQVPSPAVAAGPDVTVNINSLVEKAMAGNFEAHRRLEIKLQEAARRLQVQAGSAEAFKRGKLPGHFKITIASGEGRCLTFAPIPDAPPVAPPPTRPKA